MNFSAFVMMDSSLLLRTSSGFTRGLMLRGQGFSAMRIRQASGKYSWTISLHPPRCVSSSPMNTVEVMLEIMA